MSDPTTPLLPLIHQALEDLKAQEIVALDVTHLTTITDYFVVASGTSSRHVKSVANKVIEALKEHYFELLDHEDDDGWTLLDFGTVVVHVMLPEVRDYYQLEKLWSMSTPEKEIA